MNHIVNFENFLNEAEHKAPLDYSKLKIGDTLLNSDGTPWTEADGKKIVVLNRGIALIDESTNYVDIHSQTVLGKQELVSIPMSNIKEIAKHLK